jgi:uncharacterized DUF497 family protein
MIAEIIVKLGSYSFGRVAGRILAVLYTPRGERRRIISARRAKCPREKRL